MTDNNWIDRDNEIAKLEVKLYPRCVKFEKEPTLSATGYIVPCCWADSSTFEGMESLMKPHLHIDNVDSVEDIILSEEWDEFFDVLTNKPKEAPLICKKYCCTDKSFKNRGDYEIKR